jgi:hypothetical protein
MLDEVVGIRCPKCRAENPESDKFCGNCGFGLTQESGTQDGPIDGRYGAADPINPEEFTFPLEDGQVPDHNPDDEQKGVYLKWSRLPWAWLRTETLTFEQFSIRLWLSIIASVIFSFALIALAFLNSFGWTFLAIWLVILAVNWIVFYLSYRAGREEAIWER